MAINKDEMQQASECPSDIIDQIEGWLTQGVGCAYGEGYAVKLQFKWQTKMADVSSIPFNYSS
jgi:hypothetical protein